MLIPLAESPTLSFRDLSNALVVKYVGAIVISLLAIMWARTLARLRAWPALISFHREIKSYKRVPKRWRPSYYACSGAPSRDGSKPTYHFFVRANGVDIEEFMAFLIPPLDLGHGRQSRNEQVEEDELKFNADWDAYLRGIGKQAEKAKKKDPSSLFRRIIFMDKALLMLFVSEPDLIFKTARMEGRRFLPGPSVSPFERLARNAVRYAFDIAAIHGRVFAHKDVIESYYLDKSQVLSAKYYDFGLYQVKGVDIVYHPVYRKDYSKRIEEQRILIGTKAEQRRRIGDYRRDFEELWAIASDDRMDQKTRAERADGPYVDEKLYFKEDRLTLELFDKTYYNALGKILKDRGIVVS